MVYYNIETILYEFSSYPSIRTYELEEATNNLQNMISPKALSSCKILELIYEMGDLRQMSFQIRGQKDKVAEYGLYILNIINIG